MALKAVVAKLDDVEEAYRSLYVKRGEQYVIQVEGMKTQADIDKQLQANQAERTEHTKTKEKLKAVEEQLAAFGELKPEEVTARLEELETLKAANTPELTKNFEKIVTDRVEAQLANRIKAETTKYTKQIETLTAANNTLTEANKGFQGTIMQRTIDDAIRAEATKAKLHEGGVTDALMHGRGVFKLVDGKVVTEDGVTPEQWLEERKKSSPHWWPAAQGTGSHGSQEHQHAAGENPFTNEGWNVTKQSQLARDNPAQANRFMEQAGVPKDAAGNFRLGVKPPAKAA